MWSVVAKAAACAVGVAVHQQRLRDLAQQFAQCLDSKMELSEREEFLRCAGP